MLVSEKIFRNGVPHAVETSVVTRNAINPRNVFLDIEPPEQTAADDLPIVPKQGIVNHPSQLTEQQHPIDHPEALPQPVRVGALNTRDVLSVAKAHIRDNIQALDKLAHSDNWQTLGKSHLQDNRQSLGSDKHIEERKLYLEKKSIKDNRQKVSQTTPARSAPQLQQTSDDQTATRSLSSQTASTDRATQQATLPQGSKHSRQADELDAMQKRMKKIKASVREVNDTLSEIHPKG